MSTTKTILSFHALALAALIGGAQRDAEAAGKIKVVATIATYGSIAREIGGDRVEVATLVQGNEDPHFVQPKLSFSEKLAKADLFIDTGLDLELWVPALEETAGNKNIMSGASGYVSASAGLPLLEKVAAVDRKEGDVHVYGNPHVYNCPYCIPQIARNIKTGLVKVDPPGKEIYETNLKRFVKKWHESLYGSKLVEILGGATLDKLAGKGTLMDFLAKEQFEGKPLAQHAGGWLKQAMPIRGKKIVAYHKNWAYFARFFGVEFAEYIEPKPGLPPTPKHVAVVVDVMKKEGIKVVLAATYYDKEKVLSIAKKVDAKPVFVSISVGGEEGVKNVFNVFQKILDKLVPALGG
jgi:zinc/manganese transport system substrate-binding protein